MSEIVAAFMEAMEAAGVRAVEPIAPRLASGELIRFRCEGDKPGRQNAWAVLHLDGRPAGAFDCYRLGVSEKWRGGTFRPLSPAERRTMAVQWQEQAQQRQQAREGAQAATAARAERTWAAAGPVDPTHPYLVRKGIAGEGLKQSGSLLLVPMRDADGKLWNLQRIDPVGGKFFLKGGRTAGLMFLLREEFSQPDVLCLGEGMGTMATVRRATRLPICASFSGENLEPVARALREKWPALDLVVCGDDDAHLVEHPRIKKNLGHAYAMQAAMAVGGRLAMPPAGAST
jgi:putative DNA primase/helicase